MSLLIERGQRGVIIGATGSGKTQMLLTQLRHFRLAPIYIFDTKGDQALAQFVAAQGKNAVEISSADEIIPISKARKGPEYVHILPPPAELGEPELLDAYLWTIYAAGKPCMVCIDEAYQVHKNNRAGPGLIALLTRGRSKGITLLCCTQRPAWLSRFVFTESQHFYIYYLQDSQDYKRLREMGIPFPQNKKLDKYHFFHYKSGDANGIFYSPIPIEFDPGYAAEDAPKNRFF